MAMIGRAFAQEQHLRYFFWGGPARAANRQAAVDKFVAEKGSISASVEWAGWDDYWPRLNTQLAGGNPPDLIQMDFSRIEEFASRGTLLELDAYIPGTLQIAGFGDKRLASGKIGGKTYGITGGDNSQAMFYDVAAWDEVGVAPTNLMSWNDFRSVCEQFKAKTSRNNVVATPNRGGGSNELEVWMRQRGKSLYNGKALGFELADLVEWFDFWQAMTNDGLAATGEIQGLQQASAEGALMTQGLAAISFGWSNDLVAYAALTPNQIGMLTIPGSDTRPGQFIKPSQFLSVGAKSPNAELAVALINFLLMDPEAVKIQKLDVGVPPDVAVREALLPSLNPIEQQIVGYLGEAEKAAGNLPPPPPPGAGEVALMLNDVNTEIMFGLSPADGAQKVMDQAAAILARA
ncbi:extracellular solute-binding protein [uncultured Devosia sp.]|uniref:extracellular solute-binding protein n=1 Tax=uncultured Devosia sp. TaxID=211434 RepID=UPI0035CADF0F